MPKGCSNHVWRCHGHARVKVLHSVFHRHVHEVLNIRTHLRESAEDKWFKVELCEDYFQKTARSFYGSEVVRVLKLKLLDVLLSHLSLKFAYNRSSLADVTYI